MTARIYRHRFIALALVAAGFTLAGSSATANPPVASTVDDRQALLDLAQQKWSWMAERRTDKLDALFHPAARFVHMGATMDKAAELEVIASGRIQYKRADVSEASVELLGDTAIVFSRLRLLAVVNGTEVTNPFSVTEVYIRRDGRWLLATMAFTRLLGE